MPSLVDVGELYAILASTAHARKRAKPALRRLILRPGSVTVWSALQLSSWLTPCWPPENPNWPRRSVRGIAASS